MEASLSDIVGLASVGIKIIKDAYSTTVKHFGKKKGKAMLSEAVRETLKINPDLGAAWAKIRKSEKFVGKEDVEYIRARSLFKKVKMVKPVRVAKAKAVGKIISGITLAVGEVSARKKYSSLGQGRYTGFLVPEKQLKKGTRKTKKRRKK